MAGGITRVVLKVRTRSSLHKLIPEQTLIHLIKDVYFAGGLDFWNATDTETYTSITDCLNYCQASPVGPSAGFPNAVLRTWIGEPEKFCQCGTAISPIYVCDSICDAPCPDNPAESCGGGIAKVPGDDWGLYMYYAVYQYA